MSPVQIRRDVPGTELRPGDLIGHDEDGYFLVRSLSHEELAAILTHPECVSEPLREASGRRRRAAQRGTPYLRVVP